jgi:hypothetical protein
MQMAVDGQSVRNCVVARMLSGAFSREVHVLVDIIDRKLACREQGTDHI